MAHRPDVAAAAAESSNAGALLHVSLSAAIAVVIAVAIARPNRDAGDSPSLTLEAALPQAAAVTLLDVLAEGPVVTGAHWQPHILDVLVEGPEVSAALPGPGAEE